MITIGESAFAARIPADFNEEVNSFVKIIESKIRKIDEWRKNFNIRRKNCILTKILKLTKKLILIIII